MTHTTLTTNRPNGNRSAPANAPVIKRLICYGGFSLLFLSSVACSSLGLDDADTPMITDSGVREEFAPQEFELWKQRSFLGNTSYQAVDLEGRTVLEAKTDGTASLLFRSVNLDLNKFPVLEWAWKVSASYSGLEVGSDDSAVTSDFERTKAGDDFPARIYVVYQEGFLPTDVIAINYVWAGNEAVGESWTNPFTSKAKMLVVESGDDHVGKWRSYRRNIKEDFKTLFGVDVERLNGYAVMVDGDNSKQKTTSWFDFLAFLPGDADQAN